MELLRRWGDSSEDLGTELMICLMFLRFFPREFLPFFQLRISILTEWFQVEPHWWTCRWMGSGLSYRNYFSHFSCLFKQTVLRENLSNDLNGLKSLRLLVSQQHVQVQCFLICFCSKLTSALRFVNLRCIVPQCLEPIDVQEFVHRMEARKEFEKICLDGFFVQKIVADFIPNAFPGIGLPGRSCRIGCTTLQSSHTADTNRSAVSMLICCMFVSICTHDLNNLSAFSCFFYSYVFMCSLPEAPGMKFSFHRIYILIFLFFQSCQPCEVHNIQVQCRSCTSTIGKKKIEFCSTSESFIVECLAFPTSLIRCCFWGHIVQMLSQQERCRDYLLSIFVRCNPQVEFKLEDKKGFHVSRKLNENIIKV